MDITNLKGFKLVMLNVRSLSNKLLEIKSAFRNFDIICLCKTWLNLTVPDVLLQLDGYAMYRQDRFDPSKSHQCYKRGGGICIHVLDKYVDYITVSNEISTVSDDVEQLWLILKCPNVKQKLIGCIYRPPKGNIDRGLSNIRSSLDNVFNFNADLIII